MLVQGPIHFKEDVLRVKRSRFTSVIPSFLRASSERSEGSLAGERSFAALRMTKRDGLVFEMYWVQGLATSVPMYLYRRDCVEKYSCDSGRMCVREKNGLS